LPFQQQDSFRDGPRPHYNRRHPEDRPKHVRKIPGAEPWLLITTKLKRRFVHQPQEGTSFWKFPQEVMLAVIDMDHKDRELRERRERGDEIKPGEENLEKSPREDVRPYGPDEAQPVKPPKN